MEELLQQHKKEQKSLLAQITQLKKQASKKTRKAVNAKCIDLQKDLDDKHAKQLAEMRGEIVPQEEDVSPEALLATLTVSAPDSAPDSAPQSASLPQASVPNSASPASTPDSAPAAPKKRNRAKERIAKRQAEEEALRAEAEKEAANSVDYRAIEAESMGSLLASQGLTLKEIQPDGHCLFSSISDQLAQRHQLEVDIQTLRSQAADYIRQHKDDFVPYLFDQETMTLRDVDEYTKELEETAMWGSDMEIAALAAVYNCPIKVLVAGSAPIVFNEAGEEATLIVAYYKHSYGLGEHYNSCRDAVAGGTDA